MLSAQEHEETISRGYVEISVILSLSTYILHDGYILELNSTLQVQFTLSGPVSNITVGSPGERTFMTIERQPHGKVLSNVVHMIF